jgi:hypothetical protein
MYINIKNFIVGICFENSGIISEEDYTVIFVCRTFVYSRKSRGPRTMPWVHHF